MNQELRKALWNVYAWPVTLLYAMTVIIALAKIEPPSLANAVICFPAILALHLHIRNRKFLPGVFWKVFAFALPAWDLAYSLWLEPLQSGETISLASPSYLFLHALPLMISIPLYAAVFLYAFRDWSLFALPGATEGEPSSKKIFLINASRFLTALLCALIIVIDIFPSFRDAWYFKKKFSRENIPLTYIIPVDRIIADRGNPSGNHFKINYVNLEMSLPFKGFESKCDSPLINKTTKIKIGEGKIIDISMPEVINKGEKGWGASFNAYSRMLYMTPDQINPFIPDEKDKLHLTMILMKATAWSISGPEGSIYKFKTAGMRGFQFNISGNNAKNVLIFDKNDTPYDIRFAGFSQEEIDYILLSIRMNDKAGRPATDFPGGIKIGECLFLNKAAADKYLQQLWKQAKNPLNRGQML